MNAAVTSQDLLRRLDALLDDAGDSPCVLAFDADGTLWSGDVGEDVFKAALDHQLLRDEAGHALRAVATAFALDTSGSASELGRRLLDAYFTRRIPDLTACEFMTYCYAGWTVAQVREFAGRVLEERGLGARFQTELSPVLAWCRDRGVRAVVISASPRPVVEVAVRGLGISPSDIAAADAVNEGGVLGDAMASAVPFGVVKCVTGRALIGEARWLASFGDNFYDMDMMRAACLGVAVRPKPSLRALMPAEATVVELLR